LDLGTPVPVKCNAVAPAVTNEGLYYAVLLKQPGAWSDFEFRRDAKETSNYEVLAHVPGTRVPFEPLNFHMILRWRITELAESEVR